MPNKRLGEQPTSTVFDEISRYWAEMSDARETEAQLSLVKSNFGFNGLILDLSCGNGRHSASLCRLGFDMISLDISPRLLRIAKAKLRELALIQADMRYLPLQSDVFSGVISLDSSFGYQPSETEDLRSLREVARILMKNAFLLFDVFNGEYMLRRHRGIKLRDFFLCLARFHQLSRLFRWVEYPSFYLLGSRKIIEDGGKLRDLWIFRDKKTGEIASARHVVRLYECTQLQGLMNESGLEADKCMGDYDGQPLNADSKRIVIKAYKP